MPELLRKEYVAHCERWQTPAVEGGNAGRQLHTVAQLEELQQQAYEEAYARGYEDGRKAGAGDANARAARLDALLEQLNAPLAELDEAVERELCELTFAIARQVVRRELKTSPDEIVGAVRAALAALPVACRNVRLQLHPDDAALVREALAPADGQPAWRIVEDPVLSRGGCRVLTDTSQVDARVEKRLGAAINAVLGDERAEAHDDG